MTYNEWIKIQAEVKAYERYLNGTITAEEYLVTLAEIGNLEVA